MEVLKDYQKSIASELARDLIKYGLIVGDELKEYLILGVDRRFLFKSEEHYMEFEDCVIDFIEKKRRRIKVIDIKKGDIKIFNSTTEVGNELGISKYRVSNAINQKSLVFKRYKMEYQKIPIKDLIKN